MFKNPPVKLSWLVLIALAALLAACAPAASPSPTAAPKPTEAPKPAAPAAPVAPTASPAPAAAPTASPAAAPAAAPAASPALATKAAGASFYEGKTLRFIVGLAAGGGYDTYTRAMARYFGKYLPGNPTIVVENMVGAGGLQAANYVYKVAPQDGTVIHSFVGGLSMSELIGQSGIEFESSKFQWLGAPTLDTPVCVVRKETGLRSLLEARGRPNPIILGGVAPGGATDDQPKVLRAALNLNLKIVSGYGGTSQIRLGIDRGELDGACYSWESWKATSSDRFAAGDLVVIGQAGDKPLPDLPNVPFLLDAAQGDEAPQLFQQGIIARSKIERAYLVGPGVPRERVDLIREAFMKTLQDPDFLADAKKANLDVNPVSAEEVTQRIQGMFALPESLKARLRAILSAE